MKSLIKFIEESLLNEAALKGPDFTKHNYKYIKALMAKLLSGENVRLGEHGDTGSISIDDMTDSEIDMAKKFNDELQTGNYDDITIDRFNKIFAAHGLKLTSFFKGDYSGYVDGLESKNKGNAFESYFVKHYHEMFEDDIKKIAPYDTFIDISHDGGSNTRRPLTFTDDSITCGRITNGNYNIGKDVTDVTVKTDRKEDDGDIYLSLKSGKAVTFVNSGIKTLFPESFFTDGTKLPDNGRRLLDMLCIDESKFRDVFKNYSNGGKRKKASKERSNIKDKLKDNDVFKKFMYSVIGYGFIMVHQTDDGNVEFIDFLTEDKMKDYVKDIKDAYVEYPENGEAKRVDVIVKYDNIEFKINMRSKTAGIFPTHIMADYKFV